MAQPLFFNASLGSVSAENIYRSTIISKGAVASGDCSISYDPNVMSRNSIAAAFNQILAYLGQGTYSIAIVNVFGPAAQTNAADVTNYDIRTGAYAFGHMTVAMTVSAVTGYNALRHIFNMVLRRIDAGHGTAMGRVFYISSAGSDSAAGTSPSTAWLTIGKVNAQTHLAGDTYAFRGGDTFTDATLTVNAAGTLGAPVTVCSYGIGRATITRSTNTDAIIANNNYNTIKDLILIGAGATSTNGAVNIYHASVVLTTINFSNLDISNFLYGLSIGGNTPGGTANVTIDNCVIHDLILASTGITVYGDTAYNNTNVTVTNCVVYNTGTDGIDITYTSTGLVSNCVIHDCGAVGTNTVGLFLSFATGIVVQYCEVYNQHTSNLTDANGIAIDEGTGAVSNCTIQYCYVHNCDGSGIALYALNGNTWGGHTVRFCVTEDNGKTTTNNAAELVINATNASMGTFFVYNNTFYGSKRTLNNNAIIQIISTHGTGTIANNILVSGGNPRMVGSNGNASGISFRGNCYDGSNNYQWNSVSYTSFGAWQSAAAQEKISTVNVALVATPNLTGPFSANKAVGSGPNLSSLAAYKLIAGSHCSVAGLDLLAQFSISCGALDFYGNAIVTTALPIGAHNG